MKELTQKKFFKTRTFKIGTSKLYCSNNENGNATEFNVSFEDITGEVLLHRKVDHTLLILGLGAIFLSLTLVGTGFFTNNTRSDIFYFSGASLAVGIIFIFSFWVNARAFLKLQLSNMSYIYFYRDIPKEETTRDFIKEIMDARNKYLRANYFLIDHNLNYENQLQTLRWLKNIEVISEAEFDDKYLELKRLKNPEQANIGFGN